MRNIDHLHQMSQQETEDCINWDGSFYNNGYGTLRKGDKMVSAHREAFHNNNGYLPEVVMHTCDNPACVNVRHLQAGTTKDNVADKVHKGRQNKGSDIGNSKLTEKKVLQIRKLEGKHYQKGYS